MPPTLSIIVPAYNESARIGPTLQKIIAYLNQQHEKSELLVVDDGSTDDTAAVAEATARDLGSAITRVIRYEQNRGKGYALRRGLLESQANITLFSDAVFWRPLTERRSLLDPIGSA